MATDGPTRDLSHHTVDQSPQRRAEDTRRRQGGLMLGSAALLFGTHLIAAAAWWALTTQALPAAVVLTLLIPAAILATVGLAERVGRPDRSLLRRMAAQLEQTAAMQRATTAMTSELAERVAALSPELERDRQAGYWAGYRDGGMDDLGGTGTDGPVGQVLHLPQPRR